MPGIAKQESNTTLFKGKETKLLIFYLDRDDGS